MVPNKKARASTTKFYPRDPSLDPQLVWKGKDEQDRAELVVPVVPLHVQEVIHPLALLEGLRHTGEQSNLFGGFDGRSVDFVQKVDHYQHLANWRNRMILGDSLLVMTSLAQREGLRGK